MNWLRQSLDVSRRTFRVLIAIGVVLIVLRLLLPLGIKKYVNHTLASLENFRGEVGDVDLNLWRGAYEIEAISLVKTEGPTPVPFFRASQVDFSMQWSQLLNGALVGEAIMYRPRLNVVRGPGKATQTGSGESWTKVVSELFPFRINRFQVREGSIDYHDVHDSPPIHVFLGEVNGTARNLTNSRALSDTLVGRVEARARAMNEAPVELNAKLDPFSDSPTFRVRGSLRDLDLTRLNRFLKAYGNFDVEKGRFSLVLDVSARDGNLDGYVEPYFVNLDILNWSRDVENGATAPLQLFWEALVGTLSEAFENQPRDQLATRIPIQGRIENPETDLLVIMGGVLKNAFVKALIPQLTPPVSEDTRSRRPGPDAPETG